MKKTSQDTPSVPKASILPKETLEIAERREILLAGVLGIEDYHTDKVRVKTSMGIIEAYGSSVSLCWASEKRLLLRGHFEGLRFERIVPLKGGCRPCR